MVSPSRRRDAVTYLLGRHPVSERRACKLVGQYRSTQRYAAQPATLELQLVARMNELAAVYPRYGYRRIWALLRAEGFTVNRKRIERLWRLEGHKVPAQKARHGQKAVGGRSGSTWNLQAERPNEIWSYDFVASRTEDGQSLRILNVVDEFTRRCLACRVERSIGARDVIEVLDGLFAEHGRPRRLRSDNGREFIAQSLAQWLKAQRVEQVFIEKGSPQQNAYVERFNGSMRDEKLNGELFRSVLEARVVLAEWVSIYNTIRPHRGLGMTTPQAFYESVRKGSR
jgi:transposase InsO family protein